MKQLTSLDAQFLAVESSRTYGHVGSLCVYDPSTAPGGTLTVKDLCRMVGERLHLLPPFRWKLVNVPFGLDLPYWVEDPDFDLDFHIRESAIPPPGDDRKLAETVSRIFARPLDRTRPLWELYLIHGLPDGRVALLTKVHHAVVDGVSGNEILTVLLDPSPEGKEIPPDEHAGRHGERVPSDLEMLARGAAGVPRQPLRALRTLPSTLPALTEVPGANAFPVVPALSKGLSRLRGLAGAPTSPEILEITSARAPKTSFNGRISPHRRFAFGSLSLDAVKAIKNELGITVNDVVVTLCASAVRRWLIDRDELPRTPLVAMVPVSVRAPHEAGTFGNRISALIVPIPTDVAHPRDRLVRAHELLRGAKANHAALPASLLTDATAFIPPAVAALAARTTIDLLGRTRPPLNLVISNVPGPRESLFCAGARLEKLFPVSVVVDGVGLNMTVMSYRDHLDFGIVTDQGQIPDAWPFIDHLHTALEELQTVLHRGGRTGVRQRPRSGRAAPA
ncbi:MAG TPA: wax ester/triacylglycerol synthase family O-acyltransferase [Baekduia sp.]|uniref:WS/DGAT/MGAT family O-acyltransferase n=1 Tax=Baekduia sp. TaxID=2600305 RepID=UPI002D77FCEF|nr:wax ester/triacylglycerol synthase family O-acyltransferase [Baekduia sp.]HET6506403.1 wax ester/triacylglycerol synthase family O-acyltransferase [Baekduia sp.]